MGMIATGFAGPVFEVSGCKSVSASGSSVRELKAVSPGAGVCLVQCALENARAAGAYGTSEIIIKKNGEVQAAVNNGVCPSQTHEGTEPVGCSVSAAIELHKGDELRVRAFCNSYTGPSAPEGAFTLYLTALSTAGRLEFTEQPVAGSLNSPAQP